MGTTRLGLAVGITLFTAATACRDVSEPVRSAGPPKTMASLSSCPTPTPQWLPVGTKVPPGQAICAPPEPYDPAKHGPPLPPPTNLVNLAARPGFVSPPKRDPTVPPPPGEGDRGLWLGQITEPWYGASSVHDVQWNLTIDTTFIGRNGAWIYAPTMLPPGGACIEITQVYQRWAVQDTTGKYFGLYDWCESDSTGRFVVFDSEGDTAFSNAYIRPYQGRDTYDASIVTPATGHTYGQCWYADIYNYTLGGWQEFLRSCGNPYHQAQNYGWTMWESWYTADDGVCRSYPSIRALAIAFADPDSSKWVPITNHPSDHWNLTGGHYCWGQGGTTPVYTFESPVPGLAANTWRADTPNP